MELRDVPRLAWADLPVARIECPPGELDLALTLQSGQAFRWRPAVDGAWIGVVGRHVLRLRSTPGALEAQAFPRLELAAVADYLRLEVDLARVRAELARDPLLAPLVAAQPGLRLLRQPPEETLFAFLCTAANNIPRITRGLETLANDLGAPIAEIEGACYSAFPTARQLATCDVERARERTRLGWRPARLAAAASHLLTVGPDWLPGLRRTSLSEARRALLPLPGVGPKIADCVCLFALDKDEAVPVDTHIWRVVVTHLCPEWRHGSLTPARYEAIGALFRERYGPLAGWAQQYLFVPELRVASACPGGAAVR